MGAGEKSSGGESNASEGDRRRGGDAGADRSEVTSDQVSQGVTWDVGMALEPAKGDREEPGAVTEKGPDGEDSLDIRGGSGARGEDRQSVLAVGEDSNVPEVPDREEVKEDLKTETDSVDLGEVVGAVTKGSAEVDTEAGVVAWEEDGSAGA